MRRLIGLILVVVGVVALPGVGFGAGVSSDDPQLLQAESGWGLDVAAAYAMDGPAVILYGVFTTTDGVTTRACVRGVNGELHFGWCDSTDEQRKWFLGSSGQIRLQRDPSNCWQVMGLDVGFAPCQATPSDAQVFRFNADQTITSPSLPGKCFSAKFATFSTCDPNGTAGFFQWRIEQAPTRLIKLAFANTYYNATSSTRPTYLTAAADGTLSLQDQPSVPGSLWFLSAVPDTPGMVYIQTYPAGDCLTAPAAGYGIRPYVQRCKTHSLDQYQRWTYPTNNTIQPATNTSNCLVYTSPTQSAPFPNLAGCADVDENRRRTTLQDSGAMLNLNLVTQDPATTSPICLAASQTDFWTFATDCTNNTNIYQSVVDIWSGGSIHFQATQNCLDNYLNHLDTAAQWTCNNQKNQTWYFPAASNTSTTNSPFPIANIYSAQTLRTLSSTNNTYGTAFDPDTTPISQRTPWTLQPTNTILQCGRELQNIPTRTRQPRSPQGRALGIYLEQIINDVNTLPGTAPIGRLTTGMAALTEVAGSLGLDVPYTALRAQLRQALIDTEAGVQAVLWFAGGRQQVTPAITATVNRIGALIQAVEAVVARAATDQDITIGLNICAASTSATH